jgi:hypothetical protein
MEFHPSECSPTPRNKTLPTPPSHFDPLAPRPSGDRVQRRILVLMAPSCHATDRERRPGWCSVIRRPCCNRHLPAEILAEDATPSSPPGDRVLPAIGCRGWPLADRPTQPIPDTMGAAARDLAAR